MQPSRMRPSQARHITVEQALAGQEGQLVCRDCGQACEKKEAIRSHRQSLRCPRCGGVLERRPQLQDGQAADSCANGKADGPAPAGQE